MKAKKFLALLLSLVLIVGLLPTAALAVTTTVKDNEGLKQALINAVNLADPVIEISATATEMEISEKTITTAGGGNDPVAVYPSGKNVTISVPTGATLTVNADALQYLDKIVDTGATLTIDVAGTLVWTNGGNSYTYIGTADTVEGDAALVFTAPASLTFTNTTAGGLRAALTEKAAKATVSVPIFNMLSDYNDKQLSKKTIPLDINIGTDTINSDVKIAAAYTAQSDGKVTVAKGSKLTLTTEALTAVVTAINSEDFTGEYLIDIAGSLYFNKDPGITDKADSAATKGYFQLDGAVAQMSLSGEGCAYTFALPEGATAGTTASVTAKGTKPSNSAGVGADPSIFFNISVDKGVTLTADAELEIAGTKNESLTLLEGSKLVAKNNITRGATDNAGENKIVIAGSDVEIEVEEGAEIKLPITVDKTVTAPTSADVGAAITVTGGVLSGDVEIPVGRTASFTGGATVSGALTVSDGSTANFVGSTASGDVTVGSNTEGAEDAVLTFNGGTLPASITLHPNAKVYSKSQIASTVFGSDGAGTIDPIEGFTYGYGFPASTKLEFVKTEAAPVKGVFTFTAKNDLKAVTNDAATAGTVVYTAKQVDGKNVPDKLVPPNPSPSPAPAEYAEASGTKLTITYTTDSTITPGTTVFLVANKENNKGLSEFVELKTLSATDAGARTTAPVLSTDPGLIAAPVPTEPVKIEFDLSNGSAYEEEPVFAIYTLADGVYTKDATDGNSAKINTAKDKVTLTLVANSANAIDYAQTFYITAKVKDKDLESDYVPVTVQRRTATPSVTEPEDAEFSDVTSGTKTFEITVGKINSADVTASKYGVLVYDSADATEVSTTATAAVTAANKITLTVTNGLTASASYFIALKDTVAKEGSNPAVYKAESERVEVKLVVAGGTKAPAFSGGGTANLDFTEKDSANDTAKATFTFSSTFAADAGQDYIAGADEGNTVFKVYDAADATDVSATFDAAYKKNESNNELVLTYKKTTAPTADMDVWVTATNAGASESAKTKLTVGANRNKTPTASISQLTLASGEMTLTIGDSLTQETKYNLYLDKDCTTLLGTAATAENETSKAFALTAENTTKVLNSVANNSFKVYLTEAGVGLQAESKPLELTSKVTVTAMPAFTTTEATIDKYKKAVFTAGTNIGVEIAAYLGETVDATKLIGKTTDVGESKKVSTSEKNLTITLPTAITADTKVCIVASKANQIDSAPLVLTVKPAAVPGELKFNTTDTEKTVNAGDVNTSNPVTLTLTSAYQSANSGYKDFKYNFYTAADMRTKAADTVTWNNGVSFTLKEAGQKLFTDAATGKATVYVTATSDGGESAPAPAVLRVARAVNNDKATYFNITSSADPVEIDTGVNGATGYTYAIYAPDGTKVTTVEGKGQNVKFNLTPNPTGTTTLVYKLTKYKVADGIVAEYESEPTSLNITPYTRQTGATLSAIELVTKEGGILNPQKIVTSPSAEEAATLEVANTVTEARVKLSLDVSATTAAARSTNATIKVYRNNVLIQTMKPTDADENNDDLRVGGVQLTNDAIAFDVAATDAAASANVLKFEVIPEDGNTENTRTYTVNVNRAPSVTPLPAEMSTLKIGGRAVEIDQESKSGSVTLLSTQHTGVEFAPLNNRDTTSTFTLNGSTTLKSDISPEATVYTIGVTSGSGEKAEYKITVSRDKGITANLTALDAKTQAGSVESALTLTPAFAQATKAYTATVDNGVTALILTPKFNSGDAGANATPVDTGATLKINGTNVESEDDYTVSLVEGANLITVELFAENTSDSYKQTYTLSVTRTPKSDNATLSGLTVGSYTLARATGGNGFDPSVYAYSVSLDKNNTDAEVTIDPTPADAKATVSVSDGTNAKTMTATVKSATFTLKTGTNTFTISVIAENGTQKDYVVTIEKAAKSTDAALKTLSFNEIGATKLAFKPDTTEYKVDVGSTVAAVNWTAAASSEFAKVNGDTNNKTDSVTLNAAGMKTDVYVTVTAEDNATTRTYHVEITRAALSDSVALSSLTLGGQKIALDANGAPDANARVSLTVQPTTTTVAASAATVEAGTKVGINDDATQAASTSKNVDVSAVVDVYDAQTLTVNVKSESGITKTYTIPYTVTKDSSYDGEMDAQAATSANISGDSVTATVSAATADSIGGKTEKVNVDATTSGDTSNASVTLPSTVVDKVSAENAKKDAESTKASVEVATDAATVELSAAAMDTIKDQANGGDVSLSVKKTTMNFINNLSVDGAEINVDNVEVFSIDVLSAAGKPLEISQLSSDPIVLSFNVSEKIQKSIGDKKAVVLWNDNGVLRKMNQDDVTYSNGVVTLRTPHLSDYLVVSETDIEGLETYSSELTLTQGSRVGGMTEYRVDGFKRGDTLLIQVYNSAGSVVSRYSQAVNASALTFGVPGGSNVDVWQANGAIKYNGLNFSDDTDFVRFVSTNKDAVDFVKTANA